MVEEVALVAAEVEDLEEAASLEVEDTGTILALGLTQALHPSLLRHSVVSYIFAVLVSYYVTRSVKRSNNPTTPMPLLKMIVIAVAVVMMKKKERRN